MIRESGVSSFAASMVALSIFFFVMPFAVASPVKMGEIESLIRKERYREAERIAKELLRERPGDASVWVALGRTYKIRGETAFIMDIREAEAYLEKAKECFSKAIKLAPGESMGYIQYSECLSAEGRFVDGLKYANIALKKRGLQHQAHRVRGIAYTGLNDFSSASADFAKYLSHSPDDFEYLLMRADCEVNLKNFSEASRLYTRADRLKPSISTKKKMLDALLAAGSLPEALSGCNALIRSYPSEPLGYEKRAAVYKKMGQSDLAARDRAKASGLKRRN